MVESRSQSPTGGVFHRLVRSLSHTTPVSSPTPLVVEQSGIIPSVVDKTSSTVEKVPEAVKAAEKPPRDHLHYSGHKWDAMALIDKDHRIESAVPSSTTENAPGLVDNNKETIPPGQGVGHVQGVGDVSARSTEFQADPTAVLIPLGAAEPETTTGILDKPKALARIVGWVHIGAKRASNRDDHSPVDATDKPNMLTRVKSLVHITAKKPDGHKLTVEDDGANDTTVAAVAALVKEPEAFIQPRSISPAPLAQLVDASTLVQDSIPPPLPLNPSPSTSIPTIEAVLSSAAASITSDVDKSVDDDALVVPPARVLAQRIHDLTGTLPTPKDRPRKVKVLSPKKAKDGKPIPPAGSAEHVKDERFVHYLSTPKIMNGSTAEDGIDEQLGLRKSVWDALDALPPPGANTDNKEEEEEEEGDDDQVEVQIIEDGTVMICFPLVPGKDSQVKVADSILVPISNVSGVESILSSNPVSGVWPWPFSGWPTGSPMEERIPNKLKKKRPIQRKVWIPSQTELSMQAMWWGYRIYLPPPILVTLSDKAAEVSKVAAMITTALTWVSTNIPLESFPLPLQPMVLLFTRIIPFIGYIGAFIAWSISSIKSFDKGSGVKLTATWLLPIAIIPTAMDPVSSTTPVDDKPPPPQVPSPEEDQRTDAPKTVPDVPGTGPTTPNVPDTESSTPKKGPDGKSTALASNHQDEVPTSEPPSPSGAEKKGKHRSKWSIAGLFSA